MDVLGSPGFAGLRKLQERSGVGGPWSGYRKVWPRPGETWALYFITDAAECVTGLFHVVWAPGKSGKPVSRDILCGGEGCRVCEDPKQYADPRAVFYVYVTSIFHPTRDKIEWTQRPTSDGRAVFEERVNAVHLLVAKKKLSAQIEADLAGDPSAADYDPQARRSLLDRPYRLRAVAGTPRQEILVAGSVAAYPAEVAEVAAKLPSLRDTVLSDFSDRSGRLVGSVDSDRTAYHEGDEEPVDLGEAGPGEDIAF